MNKRYNHQKIEEKWRGVWERKKLWKVDIKKAKRPYYNLMMFPYPSAEGLHVGTGMRDVLTLLEKTIQ